MRHLILHIGNHKTGTTAIQHWLEANEDLLARRGIRNLHKPNEPHAHGYLGYVSEEAIFPGGLKIADPAAFVADLAALEGQTVVVSSENFAFFVQQAPISELAALVRPLFDRITVVCYLRRQDRQAVSHHAEGARPDRRAEWELYGHSHAALPAANVLQPLYLDYDRRIGLWERAFGQASICLRLYDRALLKGGDAVVDFADAAGIDMTGCIAPPRSNNSLDRAKARLGHIINGLTDRIEVAEALMRQTPNGTSPPRPAKGYARVFLRPYRPGNAALNARYGLSPLPDLFDDDVSDYPDKPLTTWSDEDFNRITRALVVNFMRATDLAGVPFVGDLRAAAVALAPTEPQRALRLLERALIQRPNSQVLLQMQAELSAWVAEGGPAPDLARLRDDPDLD